MMLCVIKYYKTTQRLVAECANPLHNTGLKCVLSRSCEGSDLAAYAGQGRPLGKLGAYLKAQYDPQCPDKRSHCKYNFARDSRVAARQEIKDLKSADSKELLKAERRQRKFEPEEPVRVP